MCVFVHVFVHTSACVCMRILLFCAEGGALSNKKKPARNGTQNQSMYSVCFNKIFSFFSFCNSLLFVGCLTSQQQASVSQGRICSDNFTCYHTEIETADQTFYLTQSQYTDTGLTSPSADPITPGAWQGSHWSANF